MSCTISRMLVPIGTSTSPRSLIFPVSERTLVPSSAPYLWPRRPPDPGGGSTAASPASRCHRRAPSSPDNSIRRRLDAPAPSAPLALDGLDQRSSRRRTGEAGTFQDLQPETERLAEDPFTKQAFLFGRPYGRARTFERETVSATE